MEGNSKKKGTASFSFEVAFIGKLDEGGNIVDRVSLKEPSIGLIIHTASDQQKLFTTDLSSITASIILNEATSRSVLNSLFAPIYFYIFSRGAQWRSN